MHVAILSARTGWHTDELCRALADRGHAGVVLPYEGLTAKLGVSAPESSHPRTLAPSHLRTLAPSHLSSAGVSLLHADAVLARIIPGGTLDQIIYRVDALHWLEDRGV